MGGKKAAVVKKLEGTWRADRDNETDITPEQIEDLPVPPEHFSEVTRNEWYKLAKQLKTWGILGSCDLSLLEVYVYNIGLAKEAAEML